MATPVAPWTHYVGVDRVVGGFQDPAPAGRSGVGLASGAEPASCAPPPPPSPGPCAGADGDGHLPYPCGLDCDDSDPTVFPLAPDPAGDGVDQDRDGIDG